MCFVNFFFFLLILIMFTLSFNYSLSECLHYPQAFFPTSHPHSPADNLVSFLTKRNGKIKYNLPRIPTPHKEHTSALTLPAAPAPKMRQHRSCSGTVPAPCSLAHDSLFLVLVSFFLNHQLLMLHYYFSSSKNYAQFFPSLKTKENNKKTHIKNWQQQKHLLRLCLFWLYPSFILLWIEFLLVIVSIFTSHLLFNPRNSGLFHYYIATGIAEDTRTSALHASFCAE